MSDRKAVLEALQQELQERLSRYHAHQHREAGTLEKDFAEQAVQRQNDDVVDGLEAEAKLELRQVQRALERLAEGEGDVCENCGEEINPARLKVLPFSTRCVRCAGQVLN